MFLFQRKAKDRFAFIIFLFLHYLCSLLKHHHNISNQNDSETDKIIKDHHFMCKTWAEEGRCDEYNDDDYDTDSVYDLCPKSCLVMTMMNNFLTDAIQGNTNCLKTASSNLECQDGRYNFGVPQHVDISDPMIVEILNVIHNTASHIVDTVIHNEELSSSHCRNKHEDCSYRAAMGMCQSSNVIDYDMELDCAPACQSCHSLEHIMRCSEYLHQEGNTDVWQPGDLDLMFERIIETNKTNIEIISQPIADVDNNFDLKSDLLYTRTEQSGSGQWLLAYHNFLTKEETDAIIRLGETLHFNPSTISSSDHKDNGDDGNENFQIEEWRTSHTTWCDYNCLEKTSIDNVVMKKVLHRIVNLTGIEERYIEPIQILRYQIGQFYVEHHDYIQYEQKLPGGPRILTVFLYLNDVERGGETRFIINNNINFAPKRGTMLIWPNVLNSDPSIVDDKMYHEALPVQKGIKYAVNVWFHLRDYKAAYATNCT